MSWGFCFLGTKQRAHQEYVKRRVAALQMKKCRAYYPIAGTRKAWIPCVRNAEEGSAFCRKHGDAVFGAMLGMLVYGEVVKEGMGLCGKDRLADSAVRSEDRPVHRRKMTAR